MRHYDIRELLPHEHADVATLYRVIQEASAGSNVLRAYSEAELIANMTTAGRMFGAFADEQLVAYATVAFGGEVTRRICAHVCGVELDPDRTAVHDGSGVHPAHRGQDLQDRLNEYRIAMATERGFRDIVGSVSPRNPYSLQNHFDFGFLVRGYTQLYGGLERVIIHRSVTPVAHTRAGLSVPLLEVGREQALFSRGYVGASLTWQGTVAALEFATVN